MLWKIFSELFRVFLTTLSAGAGHYLAIISDVILQCGALAYVHTINIDPSVRSVCVVPCICFQRPEKKRERKRAENGRLLSVPPKSWTNNDRVISLRDFVWSQHVQEWLCPCGGGAQARLPKRPLGVQAQGGCRCGGGDAVGNHKGRSIERLRLHRVNWFVKAF